MDLQQIIKEHQEFFEDYEIEIINNYSNQIIKLFNSPLLEINNDDYNLDNDFMLRLICYRYGDLYRENLIFDKRIEKCLIKAFNFSGNFYKFESKNEFFESCIELILFAGDENIDVVTEYYNIAINENNINAILSFANYLTCRNNIDIELVKKYYNLAISLGSVEAMFLLGNCYKCVFSDLEQMKKYYLMAIENKHVKSMEQLASHYESEKNYFLMKKYYLMAIDNGSHYAMYKLGKFYQNNKETQLMKKFYKMYTKTECNCLCKENYDCCDKNFKNNIIKILATYYESINDIKNMKKYYLLISD